MKVDVTRLSPNFSARTAKIDTITIHHMAGNLSVESCGATFASSDRQASSNYGVGTDGRIGLYVPEDKRAWTSSNRDNDNRAITIEVANDSREPDWHVSDKALEATINLCVDICRRYGFRLNYTGDKSGNLTMHKWFASTQCPGPYLESKFPYIAQEVNRRLGESPANWVTTDSNTEQKPAQTGTGEDLYYVQVGAYSHKATAEARAKAMEAEGFLFHTVMVDGMYKVQSDSMTMAEAKVVLSAVGKSGFTGFIATILEPTNINRIAQEVIWGKWGNGQERIDRLKKAGYDPKEVQALVNKLKGK